MKKSREDEEESRASSPPPLVAPAPLERGEEEDIERLHMKVGSVVCCALLPYWPEAKEFKGKRKISSKAHFANMAKQISHQLRAEIKESFLEFNGSLKGITFTPDNKAYILTKVEIMMDQLPEL